MIPKEVLKHINRIEINTKRLVNELFAGEYESAFKGQGMEFADVREYQPGDDIRAIDWNITARFGKPFIKKYVETREMTVMLMVDMSASQQFGSGERTKGDLAAEIAALIAFSAIKNSDKTGIIIFTSEIEKYIPPKKGRSHILRIIREVLYFKPKNKGTDISKALKFLIKVCKKKSIAFIFSDFLSEGYEHTLKVCNNKHDLVALCIKDPREESLPTGGIVKLEDPETGEFAEVDSRDSGLIERFNAFVREETEKRGKLFTSNNLDFINLSTRESYIEPLLVFFRNRARRMR